MTHPPQQAIPLILTRICVVCCGAASTVHMADWDGGARVRERRTQHNEIMDYGNFFAYSPLCFLLAFLSMHTYSFYTFFSLLF
jgi:hypothetical protein